MFGYDPGERLGGMPMALGPGVAVMTPPPLRNAFDPEEILTGILRWVRIESPTYDLVAVNRMMDGPPARWKTSDG